MSFQRVSVDLDADRQIFDEPGRQSERREPRSGVGCELSMWAMKSMPRSRSSSPGNWGSGHTGVTTTGVVANIARQTRISRRRSG